MQFASGTIFCEKCNQSTLIILKATAQKNKYQKSQKTTEIFLPVALISVKASDLHTIKYPLQGSQGSTLWNHKTDE